MKKKLIMVSLALLFLLPLTSSTYSMLNRPPRISTNQQTQEIIQIEPDPNSVLHLALGYYVDKLNPVSSTTAYDWEILGLLFDGFTIANPFDYFNIEADIPWMLAEPPEWQVVYDPSLGKNISYWVFKLRQGIKFFDGRELTADDVVFTYDFLKWCGPDVAELWDLLIGVVINATKIDDYTVKVFVDSTGLISSRYVFTIVFPKHIYEVAETWGGKPGDYNFPNWTTVTPTMINEYRAKSPSDPILTGYGPFKLKSWSPEGLCTEAITFILERNPDYFMRAVDAAGNIIWEWHELTEDYVEEYGADAFRGPYIKEIHYRVIIEPADIVGALLAGEIDMGADFAFGRYYNDLIGAGFTLSYAPRLGFGHTMVNTRNWPLSEPAFRRALAYAYDKRAVCQSAWAGWAEPLDVPVPKSMGEWSIEYMTFKPDSYADHNKPKALEELKSIGIYDRDGDGWVEGPDGQEITISMIGTDASDIRIILGTLKESVEKVGIHVDTKFVDFRTLLVQVYSSQFEVAFFGFGLGRLPTFLELFASWGRESMITGYVNPEYDEIIEEAFYQETDLDKIKELVWQAQLILFYDLPIIPIYQNVIVGAYKSVKDFGTDGWAGVLEDLTGSPVLNGYTIMKAVKPKSYTIIITTLPETTTTTAGGVAITETEVVETTTPIPTTIVQIMTTEAGTWIGLGLAINIIALAVASIIVTRRPGE